MLPSSNVFRDAQNSPMGLSYAIYALQDPNHPKCCAGSLSASLAELHKMQKNNPTADLTRYQEYWSTIYRFIFTKRTDEQVSAVLQRLGTCTCEKTRRDSKIFHKAYGGIPQFPGPITPADAFLIIIVLFGTISRALEQSGGKSMAKGDSSRWPKRMEDLLPDGPDQVVQNVIQWYRIVPHPFILGFGATLLRICKSLVSPSLAKYNFMRLLVDVLSVDMANVFSPIPKEDHNGEATTDAPPPPPHPHVHPPGHRHSLITAAPIPFLQFLDELSQLEPLESQMRIMDGLETMSLQFCSLLCYLVPLLKEEDPHLAGVIERYAPRQGHLLFRRYYMHTFDPPHPDIPVHPKIADYDKAHFPPSEQSPEYTAGTGTYDLRWQARKCSAYLCFTYFQQVGASFQRCSQCKIVSYCGKKCQAKDWRDEDYPHKLLCPIISVIGGSAPMLKAPVLRVAVADGRPPQKKDTEAREEMPAVIESLVRSKKLTREQILLVEGWLKRTHEVIPPWGLEYTPGFADYRDILQRLFDGKLPGYVEPEYMDRLARWPEEIEIEKELLEHQPFWGEEFYW